MTSSLRNSVLILALAILLPITILMGVELATLNENEHMLEQVYREQLDGVIFSINQYGADLFDFYTKQIDYAYNQGGLNALKSPDPIEGNLIIDYLAVWEKGEAVQIDLKNPTRIDLNLDSVFTANASLIERLIRYKETGYIKQEVIQTVQSGEFELQVSLIIVGQSTPCLIFLNPTYFVEDLLAPKIQQITTQTINVAITDKGSGDTLYTSEMIPKGIIQRSDITKTPGYEIAVSLQAESVGDIIAYRTRRNFIALIGTIATVLIGMMLILRNLRKEAYLNKVKADFIANLSHEIRTPLSLISMFNETLLLGRVKEEKKKEYYEIIGKETTRLKNIVNKILSFSQIDANKKSYNLTRLNADETVTEIINSYSYHLEEKGFRYTLDLTSNTNINADEEAFTEVIINLLDNAMKYSMEEKAIAIESRQENNMYVLKIRDKGVGIAKKDQESIFEKFFRVDGGDIHTTKGTGLGLALVTEIIKAHGASITVDSELGKGSTFILKFPML